MAATAGGQEKGELAEDAKEPVWSSLNVTSEVFDFTSCSLSYEDGNLDENSEMKAYVSIQCVNYLHLEISSPSVLVNFGRQTYLLHLIICFHYDTRFLMNGDALTLLDGIWKTQFDIVLGNEENLSLCSKLTCT